MGGGPAAVAPAVKRMVAGRSLAAAPSVPAAGRLAHHVGALLDGIGRLLDGLRLAAGGARVRPVRVVDAVLRPEGLGHLLRSCAVDAGTRAGPRRRLTRLQVARQVVLALLLGAVHAGLVALAHRRRWARRWRRRPRRPASTPSRPSTERSRAAVMPAWDGARRSISDQMSSEGLEAEVAAHAGRELDGDHPVGSRRAGRGHLRVQAADPALEVRGGPRLLAGHDRRQHHVGRARRRR
jgi:hypothetical protein